MPCPADRGQRACRPPDRLRDRRIADTKVELPHSGLSRQAARAVAVVRDRQVLAAASQRRADRVTLDVVPRDPAFGLRPAPSHGLGPYCLDLRCLSCWGNRQQRFAMGPLTASRAAPRKWTWP